MDRPKTLTVSTELEAFPCGDDPMSERTTETIYCAHGKRGDCTACGRIIVIRYPL